MQNKKFICFLITNLLAASLVVSAESANTAQKNEFSESYKEGEIWSNLGEDIIFLLHNLKGDVKKLKEDIKKIKRDVGKLKKEIKKIWEFIEELEEQISSPIECPSDMVKINDYCMDKEANSPAGFWEQVKLCGDEGKRICIVSEWSYACQIDHSEIEGIGEDKEWAEGFYFNSDPSCEMKGQAGFSEPKRARCCK